MPEVPKAAGHNGSTSKLQLGTGRMTHYAFEPTTMWAPSLLQIRSGQKPAFLGKKGF